MAKREVISPCVYAGILSALQLWGNVPSWGGGSLLTEAVTAGRWPRHSASAFTWAFADIMKILTRHFYLLSGHKRDTRSILIESTSLGMHVRHPTVICRYRVSDPRHAGLN